MKVVRDAAWQAFTDAAEASWFEGRRIKHERDRTLSPGGRCQMTLFESVEDGRPHPRMRFRMAPATDPNPDALTVPTFGEAPADMAAFEALVEAQVTAAEPALTTADLTDDAAPAGSPLYWRNSIRVQRTARLFDGLETALKGWIAEGALPAAARPCLAYQEDRAYARAVRFDDADTGTYHSYGHDAPFVHYLEAMLKALPEPHSPGFVVLPAEQQQSVRRQRAQAQNHLDHLMRHKYAHEVIKEIDIERTLGGVMIDRETREVLSETPESKGSLTPAYELLRVDPASDHPHAGAWVHWSADGMRLANGDAVTVDESVIRRIPVDAAQVTFRRAPKSPLLRADMRLDWDGNGYVQRDPISWVSWAGHCDIKAIMEQLGVTLTGQAALHEHRTDSRETTEYTRDLLLEMVASALELGSVYRRADGSGRIQRGEHHFGGFRNDSRPDRIQFTGPVSGQGLRWPLTTRKESLTVVGMTDADGEVDLNQAFHRHHGDAEDLTIADNPRFLKTVEGDYNLIDISGAQLTLQIEVDSVDPTSGYPITQPQRTTLDLRPDAPPGRDFLGTWLRDPNERTVFRVYLERETATIVAEADEYVKDGEKWVAQPAPAQTIRMKMARPLEVTLSREMGRDDPGAYQTLLREALRLGRNINADTDMNAPVWNGTVTSLKAEIEARNPDTRVERWAINLRARFGSAAMRYLLQRGPDGTARTFVPIAEGSFEDWPDFLWQDFPDVGSKGVEAGAWVINEAMLERGIVERRVDHGVPGDVYVEDDHIKNLFEVIYAALAGYRWTIVHANKRYGFSDEAAWTLAAERIEALAAAVNFAD